MRSNAAFWHWALICSIVASGLMLGLAQYRFESIRGDAEKRCRLEDGVPLHSEGEIYCIPRSLLKKVN